MRLKILLVASLLLSAALIGAAAYKVWNDGRAWSSQTNGNGQTNGNEQTLTREEAIGLSRNSSTMRGYLEDAIEYSLFSNEVGLLNVTEVKALKESNPQEFGSFPEDHGVWKVAWIIYFQESYGVNGTLLTQYIDEVTGTMLLEKVIAPYSLTEVRVEAVQHPFKLVAELSKTNYTQGEAISITIKLVNIGEDMQYVLFRHSGPWLVYNVANKSNHTIFQQTKDLLYWMVVEEVSLNPKESITATYKWYQTDDEGHVVPPGTYKIIAYLQATHEISIETPPIEITINI